MVLYSSPQICNYMCVLELFVPTETTVFVINLFICQLNFHFLMVQGVLEHDLLSIFPKPANESHGAQKPNGPFDLFWSS